MFEVGQKVVCIDDFPPRTAPEKYPIKDSIYTVRAVLTFHNGTGVLLVEIINEQHKYLEGLGEVAFGINKFAPITFRRTDADEAIEERLTTILKEYA